MKTKQENIIHFLDSVRGVYIPRDFAESIKKELLHGVSSWAWETIQKPDDPFYWDAWESVLNNARVIYNGVEYRLHHDGDLWLLAYGELSEEEYYAFFGD